MQAYAETMAAAAVTEHSGEEVQAQVTAPGATASVVCGVIGLFLFGIILGCVAIAKANSAKKLLAEHPDRYSGGGKATTGLVLGVVDIVGAVVGLIALMAK